MDPDSGFGSSSKHGQNSKTTADIFMKKFAYVFVSSHGTNDHILAEIWSGSGSGSRIHVIKFNKLDARSGSVAFCLREVLLPEKWIVFNSCRIPSTSSSTQHIQSTSFLAAFITTSTLMSLTISRMWMTSAGPRSAWWPTVQLSGAAGILLQARSVYRTLWSRDLVPDWLKKQTEETNCRSD